MRVSVVDEAKEEYLIRKRIAPVDEILKLSNEELTDYYYKVIEEKGLEEDAEAFSKKWYTEHR